MRLLSLDAEGIQKLIDGMENEVSDIKKNALSLSWHMRGGATYEDVLNMSSAERTHIMNMISEHMDLSKKSGLPFF
jgi:hypothetical protein